MALASTVVESRLFKESNIAFQYLRYSTDQHDQANSICLCLNRLNIFSKYGFGFNGC